MRRLFPNGEHGFAACILVKFLHHAWRNVASVGKKNIYFEVLRFLACRWEPPTNLIFGLVLPWQESTTDYVNSIQDAINDAKAKAEDFNSREKVMNTLL